MPPRASLFGIRLATLIALFTSAALYVDYTHAVPSFCGAGSGCQAVRISGFGYVRLLGELYVPMPLLGLLGFSLLLGWALTPALTRWVSIVAVLGGLAGLALFVIQAVVIRQFCLFCVITDSCAIAAGALGIAFWPERHSQPESLWLGRGGWVALGILAIAAPVAWPSYKPAPEIPAAILALYVPGKINVVEYADYECPVCRAYQPTLHTLLEAYGERVHFVRLNFPLKMHEYARDAARAQVCAREQGKGDPMAEALLKAEDLRPEADRALAGTLGVELGAYDACIASGLADRKIEQDGAPIADILQGLPTTFVGAKTLIGLQSEPALRDAFDRAAQGNTERGIPAPLYLLGCLVVAGLAAWGGRAPRATL